MGVLVTAGRLAGKVALVTGSTTGIGRSVAEEFARQGATVAVSGRNAERGAKVVARISDAGGTCEFFELDITDETSVHRTIDAVADRFGGLTTLVNNAAPTDKVAASYGRVHELDTALWNDVLLGTLTGGVFWTSKYAWPHLAAGGNASIVNVSSLASRLAMTGLAAYGAAKGGVNALTRLLAAEGAADGIRANCILVGRVVSGRSDSGRAAGAGHLTRIGNPMDVAHCATWLAADESAFVTAAQIDVDGGFGVNGDAILGVSVQKEST